MLLKEPRSLQVGRKLQAVRFKNKDGKLLMKDTKKATSRNGKTKINRNKARVTKNFKK